ncbi:Sister chromatid cohesion 1 protein [Thalictrum thalictroides]|uniref:Sister chromatid cohesion 1 protein n=1 Tax=Thalictrum thalictroides TaxID=46969 RepID=A0A7J6UXC4_THATH|nr:Sister chromatid cohesion 1 protein [Thalictrum thalictroides]
MMPDVPIALRMQAFLLLGVVRIYSRKVDYLYRDCNEIMSHIRTSFASIKEIDLPEGETHANFESITLPERFELDALDLDDEQYHEGFSDNHIRDSEGITLADQIPYEAHPYTTFFEGMDVSCTYDSPMDEDVPSCQVNSGVGVSDHVPVDQPDDFSKNPFTERFHEDEIEGMLDAGVHDFESDGFRELLERGNDITEQHQPKHQTTMEKGNLSPIMEDPPHSGGHFFSLQPHTGPPSTAALPESVENFHTISPGFGLGNNSFELPPTPPVENKNTNPRKRKQFFDKSVVLSNQFIKEGLNDASGLVCKRKMLQCSALDVWMFSKRSRKDQVFLDSSISGLCVDLQDISKNKLTKVHTFPEEDVQPEDQAANSSLPIPGSDIVHADPAEDTHLETGGPSSNVPIPEHYDETERLRFEEDHDNGISLPECNPSPCQRDDLTPLPGTDIHSEPPTGTHLHTEPLPTVERTPSTEPIDFDMETPVTRFEQQTGIDKDPSDVPELNTAEGEKLRFLDADNTPAGQTEECGLHFLSPRTIAVAQYLSDQSPRTETSNHPSGKLSLNKILEGKTRKKCARMFFETLVLKRNGIIDVKQEEAYGDITLLLDPLSNANF